MPVRTDGNLRDRKRPGGAPGRRTPGLIRGPVDVCRARYRIGQPHVPRPGDPHLLRCASQRLPGAAVAPGESPHRGGARDPVDRGRPRFASGHTRPSGLDRRGRHHCRARCRSDRRSRGGRGRGGRDGGGRGDDGYGTGRRSILRRGIGRRAGGSCLDLRGRRYRDRRRVGRRHGRRRRSRARREQRERVDVALRLRRQAHAEVDIRLLDLGVAARADRADRRALRDGGVRGDRDRAQMRQRHRVAVGRLDRDALPRGRHRAGEGHRARGGCDHGGAGSAADVDAPVLAARIRMARIEDEGLKDGAA